MLDGLDLQGTAFSVLLTLPETAVRSTAGLRLTVAIACNRQVGSTLRSNV